MKLARRIGSVLPWPLIIILLASFVWRVHNLDYNVPFGDEAVYVVVGRFGVFEKDWITYNANGWMAGSQYLYPVMTALAYQFGGIVGSRFLNVVLGVLLIEIVYLATVQLYPGPQRERRVAGLIAAAMTAGSAVGYYVSRLATLDMPSFYLFFLGLLLLICVKRFERLAGRVYFLAALLICVAFLTKITVVMYVPLVLVLSLWDARRMGGSFEHLWRMYFAGILIVFFASWTVLSWTNIQSFFTEQIVERERGTYSEVLAMYFERNWPLWIIWTVASVGMLRSKRWQMWMVMTWMALVVLVAHLAGRRVSTFDKHIFLAVPFLSVMGGIGVTWLLAQIRHVHVRQFQLGMVLGVLALYWGGGMMSTHYYNQAWADTSRGLSFLQEEVKSGERVLAEVGPAATLALYDQNYPLNVVNFDYLNYRAQSGDEAFRQAVAGGFFDVIQLQDGAKSAANERIHQLVRNNLEAHYVLIYEEDGFMVYRHNRYLDGRFAQTQ